MQVLALVTAVAALVGPVAARVQFQRLPPATGDERFRVRTAYALAQEGTIWPYLFNDGNLVGLGYQAWARSGDVLGGRKFGAYVDKTGAPINTPMNTAPADTEVSNNPDFTSLLNFGNTTTVQYNNHYEYTPYTVTVPTNVSVFNSSTGQVTWVIQNITTAYVNVTGPLTINITANILYSVTHFEWGNPATAYVTRLHQEAVNGSISAVSTAPVNFSAYNGLMTPCAGSVTPWQTHLGGEEQDPDARRYTRANLLAGMFAADQTVMAVTAYMGVTNSPTDQAAVFNPYMYGYHFEVIINPTTGAATGLKRFTMGRGAWEMGLVMPDRSTVYLAMDRGSGSPFLYYKSNRPNLLTAGALYVATVAQTGSNIAANKLAFRLTWRLMANSTDTVVQNWARSLTFDNIFDYAAPNPVTLNTTGLQCTSANTCPPGFTLTPGLGSSPECLRLKSASMASPAAFLETNRYAAMVGGTVEFTKLEGMTYDSKRNSLYISLTNIDRPMLDVLNDGSANAIRLLQNPCGCVLAMPMSSRFLGATMTPLLCGYTNAAFSANPYFGKVPMTYNVAGIPARFGATAPRAPALTAAYSYPSNAASQFAYNSTDDLDLNKNNVCDIGGIAGPDNIAYVPGHDGLLIGEDTDLHQNDMVWYYDFGVAAFPAVPGRPAVPPLTRIFTAPFGAETTSVYWYPNINGWAYLINVVQHPYSEDSKSRVTESPSEGYAGYIGYIGHNLAYEYYKETTIVGGFPLYGELCPQGTDPNYDACNDNNPCTVDICGNTGEDYFWKCSSTPISPCKLCSAANATTCSDANACTLDQCVWGQALTPGEPGTPPGAIGACQASEADPQCRPCTAANRTIACNDDNSCTHDRCLNALGNDIVGGAGTCDNTQPYGAAFEGCSTCTAASVAACDDGNTCTKTGCDVTSAGGICIHVPVAGAKETGCALCSAANATVACNDADACTEDICTDGVCVNVPVNDCESCTINPDTGVSSYCTPLLDAWPYDPTSGPISWPYNFPQNTAGNFTSPPFCARVACVEKRCVAQADPVCCAGGRCNQCGAFAHPSPIPASVCSTLLPTRTCRTVACVGSACQYVLMPVGSTCRIGGVAGRCTATGTCSTAP